MKLSKPFLILMLLLCLLSVSNSLNSFAADLVNTQASDIRDASLEQAKEAFRAKDYKTAFSLFSVLANQGAIEAQYDLGWMYYKGLGIEKNIEQSLVWYKRAGEKGVLKAQLNLASIYLKGIEVKQNYIKASTWWLKAAMQGNAQAQSELGKMYESGLGVKQDYAEAMKWYRKAAEQGYASAQSNLGLMYDNGYGVKQDYAESMKWYRKAAKQENAAAQSNLGQMYEYGRGVKQDYAEAIKWYRQAAKQENANAQLRLGRMYFEGKGVKKDDAESMKWYRKAAKWYRKGAEQGNANAQFSLGEMYFEGHGVKQDYAEAIKWYRKAAEQGYDLAQHNLGKMYFEGHGVKQDYTKAEKWYRKEAEQGNSFSQFQLGLMYFEGKDVKQDYVKAVKWWRKAAEQGDASAQSSLGDMYFEGKGVQKDYTKAEKWYSKAADQDDIDAGYSLANLYYNEKKFKHAIKWYRKVISTPSPYESLLHYTRNAQFSLGVMYDKGQGVKQDYAEAVKWYRKAAELGSSASQFNLGVMYSNGQGVLKSGAAAADWYYKAGLSYLKENDRDGALQSVERIKNLSSNMHLTVPNGFLANKLLAKIYGGREAVKTSPKTKQKKATHQMVSGTGWPVVGGYVVTNHHVIAGRHEIVLVRKDGVKIKATVVADDAINDLALLKPASQKNIPPALPLANHPVQVGEQVFTVGYPHPDLMGIEPKLTQGIVNARTGITNDPRTYQISVPIQGGNSGGPLINMRGEVVGVTTSKLSAAKVFKWTGDLPQNVNYAIKSGYVQILLSSIDPVTSVSVLPVMKGSLAGLAKRIEGSVLMVIAK